MAPAAALELHHVTTAAEVEKKAAALAEQDFPATPGARLVRMYLVACGGGGGGGETRLVVVASHLVLDGAGAEILLGELLQAYRAPAQLAWPAPQYEEYLAWQETATRASEDFWRAEVRKGWRDVSLADADAATGGGDRRTAVRSRALELPRVLEEGLQAAGEADVQAVLLAALARVVGEAGGLQRPVVGLVSHKRLAQAHWGVLGNCADVVPLWIDCGGGGASGVALAATAAAEAAVRAAQGHLAVPSQAIRRLAEDAGGREARPPAAVLNFAPERLATTVGTRRVLHGVTVEDTAVGGRLACYYELELNVRYVDGRLRAVLAGDAARVSEQRLAEIGGRLVAALGGVVAERERRAV